MMHTFRLIRMAGEIARTGRPAIKRLDREELLSIRQEHTATKTSSP